jgi:RecB family endonuclease NucS
MRVIIAECSVSYEGRLSTKLPPAVRAIFLKDDGSVAIHSDDKAYKPLNWMTKPKTIIVPPIVESPTQWVFANKKEELNIVFHKVFHDSSHELEKIEPGLQKRGTESDLQKWLFANPKIFGKSWIPIAREYPTGAGPVDLFFCDPTTTTWFAVEVKRTAHIHGIDQLSRYVEALTQSEPEKIFGGVIAAFEVKPSAKKLAENRGFKILELGKNWNIFDVEELN